MKEYKASRTETMDRIFAIKELYAAVDHLEELLQVAENAQEKQAIVAQIELLTELRRSLSASIGKDKRYACLFKHLAGASKALEEVWLATHDDSDLANFYVANGAFRIAAQRYTGEDLSTCERCETEMRDGNTD